MNPGFGSPHVDLNLLHDCISALGTNSEMTPPPQVLLGELVLRTILLDAASFVGDGFSGEEHLSTRWQCVCGQTSAGLSWGAAPTEG